MVRTVRGTVNDWPPQKTSWWKREKMRPRSKSLSDYADIPEVVKPMSERGGMNVKPPEVRNRLFFVALLSGIVFITLGAGIGGTILYFKLKREGATGTQVGFAESNADDGANRLKDEIVAEASTSELGATELEKAVTIQYPEKVDGAPNSTEENGEIHQESLVKHEVARPSKIAEESNFTIVSNTMGIAPYYHLKDSRIVHRRDCPIIRDVRPEELYGFYNPDNISGEIPCSICKPYSGTWHEDRRNSRSHTIGSNRISEREVTFGRVNMPRYEYEIEPASLYTFRRRDITPYQPYSSWTSSRWIQPSSPPVYTYMSPGVNSYIIQPRIEPGEQLIATLMYGFTNALLAVLSGY